MKLKGEDSLLCPQRASVCHNGQYMVACRKAWCQEQGAGWAQDICAQEEREWGHLAPRSAPGEPLPPTRLHSLKVLQFPQAAAPAGNPLCKCMSCRVMSPSKDSGDTVPGSIHSKDENRSSARSACVSSDAQGKMDVVKGLEYLA